MVKEENVYEEMLETEENATAKESDTGRENIGQASTVLGKFKDVDALAKAYSSLQAEFTRRSQRLKELENAAKNRELGKSGTEDSGAEKLRKNAEVRRKATKEFNDFVSEMEKPIGVEEKEDSGEGFAAEECGSSAIERENEKNAFAQKDNGVEEIAPSTCEEKENGEAERMERTTPTEERIAFNVGETSLKNETVRGVATGEEASLDPELLFNQVSRNEKVRLRIIAEYLDSIGKSGVPLTSGNAGVFAAPPVRAKSIYDAGDMALQYFKKPVL